MRRNLQPLSDYLDQWFLTWVRWASLRGSSDVRQWSVRSDQKYFSIVAQLNFVKFECVCVCVCVWRVFLWFVSFNKVKNHWLGPLTVKVNLRVATWT